MNVRVPFNFITWNTVVYISGYVITYIIKTTEPNHLILILNLANKSYFIIKVNFCHLLAWFKNYDPLKVGVNSFWDTLYSVESRHEYVQKYGLAPPSQPLKRFPIICRSLISTTNQWVLRLLLCSVVYSERLGLMAFWNRNICIFEHVDM